MASQIPREFIDQLLSKTDLVDVVDARVKLKKQGKDYYARCPFHMEKRASFTVSGDKQFYHCFGCGANGNALGFLMALDKLSFPEAVEELALRTGLTVPRETALANLESRQPSRQQLYQLLEKLAVYYQEALLQSSGQPACDYLQRRGLTAEVIQRFRLGFAESGWERISRRFGGKAADRQLLNSAGMLVEDSQGRCYDRFRNRLLFPIRNARGQVIAFGGRVLDQGTPKYLNSPETPLFHKSRTVYGLYEVRQLEPNPRQIVVVEGYMDVLSLAQYGIHYAVASLGTATTAEQIAQLLRITDSLIFCYDGDNAGREAAWRALETALPQLQDGVQLKFMFLPQGEDPDSFIQQRGVEAFQASLKQAEDLSSFLLSNLLQQIDLSTPEGCARLSARALPLMSRVPGEVLRIALREQLARKLGLLDERQLERLLPKQSQLSIPQYQPPQLQRTPMRLLVALLVQNPQLAQQVPQEISTALSFQLPGLSLFKALLTYCRSHPEVTTGKLLGYWQSHRVFRQLETLAVWDHMIDHDYIAETFTDMLYHVYTQFIEQRMDQLIAKDRQAQLSQDERSEYVRLLAIAKKVDPLSSKD
jgi:DNA primase